MADIDIPFNYDPVSVTVQTGTYTVPAGNFARVRVVNMDDGFKIDTVSVLDVGYTSGSNSTGGGPGVVYTNQTTSDFILYVWDTTPTTPAAWEVTNSAGYAISTASTNQSVTTLTVPPNFSLRHGSGTTPNGNSGQWEGRRVLAPEPKDFWVTGGTQLDGNTYVVELYNKID